MCDIVSTNGRPLDRPAARREPLMAQDQERQEQAKQWGRVVARAWSDEPFKQRLLRDPRAALTEIGVPVPPGLELEVHESTRTHVVLVLPPPPQGLEDGKLSLDQLDQVAGGFSGACDCGGKGWY